jgi:hypothetical protein
MPARRKSNYEKSGSNQFIEKISIFSFFAYIFSKNMVEIHFHLKFKPQALKEGGKQALITERVLNQVV